MKNLFIKSIFILIPILIVLFSITIQYNDGYVDPFYLRLISQKQKSLIIGTSRAAQGIVPNILDEELGEFNGGPFYNFAFTLLHSSYGPYYNRQIKSKLNHNTKNGVFILAVDPWALSTNKFENNIENFREVNTFIGKLSNVNTNPNLAYIFRYVEKPHYKVFLKKDRDVYLHSDGWLETFPPPLDTHDIRTRIKLKIVEYKNTLENSHISVDRLTSLKSIIKYLKSHGTVVLIRIPISEDMYQLERILSPDFDTLMLDIAKENKIKYLNYINHNDRYQTIDGNHLFKESSKAFTRQLAQDLIRNN